MHLLNKGNKPTFENSIRTKILDITFCNGAGLNFVENFVRHETTFSDHKLIKFNLNSQMVDTFLPFHNVKKTNWSQFKIDLEGLLSEVDFDNLDIETGAKILEEVLLKAYHDNCRLREKKKESLDQNFGLLS